MIKTTTRQISDYFPTHLSEKDPSQYNGRHIRMFASVPGVPPEASPETHRISIA